MFLAKTWKSTDSLSEATSISYEDGKLSCRSREYFFAASRFLPIYETAILTQTGMGNRVHHRENILLLAVARSHLCKVVPFLASFR
jgi:hypothetical protein